MQTQDVMFANIGCCLAEVVTAAGRLCSLSVLRVSAGVFLPFCCWEAADRLTRQQSDVRVSYKVLSVLRRKSMEIKMRHQQLDIYDSVAIWLSSAYAENLSFKTTTQLMSEYEDYLKKTKCSITTPINTVTFGWALGQIDCIFSCFRTIQKKTKRGWSSVKPATRSEPSVNVLPEMLIVDNVLEPDSQPILDFGDDGDQISNDFDFSDNCDF